ncbi:MAG: 3-hydroxyacyl-CoA dehydrogenase [Bacteroidetes bacterium]|jgi:3-hydroxybutyryl-CoA dehydrogenase|nr:3-hydroxyacyl-CoA dehydrogenase [Bacteroidota bacterium]
MKVLLLGEEARRAEALLALTPHADHVQAENIDEVDDELLCDIQVVLDLNADEDTTIIDQLELLSPGTVVIASAVKSSLFEMVNGMAPDKTVIGMNCLPTFINRPVKEVSLLAQTDSTVLKETMDSLGWEYQVVSDRVGMVSPRIVCMIVNEACYTLQEGTASIEDIDKSMKLGTAYPQGPFEWADMMGVRNVYEVLVALYDDTKDERYKICHLLKEKYQRNGRFYQ